jgi:hypothetical protein
MTLFHEIIDKQDGMSLCRLHVAAKTRESASLLRLTVLNARSCVSTSLCQGGAVV